MRLMSSYCGQCTRVAEWIMALEGSLCSSLTLSTRTVETERDMLSFKVKGYKAKFHTAVN